MMPTKVHIFKKHGDTKQIIFHVVSKDAPTGVNLNGWANFVLRIDPNEFPTNGTSLVETISGVIVDLGSGKVGFSPSGNVPTGNYFYNARGTDAAGGIFTFAQGKFVVEGDI